MCQKVLSDIFHFHFLQIMLLHLITHLLWNFQNIFLLVKLFFKVLILILKGTKRQGIISIRM